MTKSAVVVMMLLLAAGCTSARKSTPNAEGPDGMFRSISEEELAAREYRVDPPDEVVVRAPNIKELDTQKQKVRPDGKITLNLVGEIYVAGMTPTQINTTLRKLVEKHYVNPDIRVEVINNSKFYYVFGPGAVKQGRYPYTGRETVVTALAEAGFSDQAWPKQVRVSRPPKEPGQKPATAVIDFKKVYTEGELTQNYVLEDGDIIEVPRSPLAAWDFKTRQILGPITGTAAAAGTATSVGRTNGNGGR